MDHCSSHPCLHDGVCINNYDGFKCECIDSWFGDICEERQTNESEVKSYVLNRRCRVYIKISKCVMIANSL